MSGLTTFRKHFPAATMIAAVGLLPWLYWNDDVVCDLLRYWWTGTIDQFVSVRGSYDQAFRVAAGEKNAAIQLIHFDPDNRSNIGIAQQAFCRGSYTLYPRRIWAADEGTILNGGRDAIKANFRPSLQWLWAHDVHSVMHFTIKDDGEPSVDIRVVPPRTQP